MDRIDDDELERLHDEWMDDDFEAGAEFSEAERRAKREGCQPPEYRQIERQVYRRNRLERQSRDQ